MSDATLDWPALLRAEELKELNTSTVAECASAIQNAAKLKVRAWCAHVVPVVAVGEELKMAGLSSNSCGTTASQNTALSLKSTYSSGANKTLVFASLWTERPSGGDQMLPEGDVHLTVRSRVFAPHTRGLRNVTVRNLVIHGSGNQYCASFYKPYGFAQSGALGTRSGYRWRIENNTILHARTIAMDFGGEGVHDNEGTNQSLPDLLGEHWVVGNAAINNGGPGLQGWLATGYVGYNFVGGGNWRTQCGAYEAAAIKTHGFKGIMEANFVHNNTGYAGIWFDMMWSNFRHTRNLHVDNGPWLGEHEAPQWMNGLMLEISTGPAIVDNNVITGSTTGPGFFGQDCENVLVL